MRDDRSADRHPVSTLHGHGREARKAAAPTIAAGSRIGIRKRSCGKKITHAAMVAKTCASSARGTRRRRTICK